MIDLVALPQGWGLDVASEAMASRGRPIPVRTANPIPLFPAAARAITRLPDPVGGAAGRPAPEAAPRNLTERVRRAYGVDPPARRGVWTDQDA